TDALVYDDFDLIHARLVLIHVADPWQAIRRLIATLKPGGWLVIEDFDPSFADRSLPCADGAAAELTIKVFQAMRTLMQNRGLDVEFARNLYANFAAMGLVAVGMEATWTCARVDRMARVLTLRICVRFVTRPLRGTC